MNLPTLPGEETIRLVLWALLGVVILAAAGWGVHLLRAPLEAQLDATVGANKALEKGAEATNAGVDALQKDGKARQARSAAAVQRAGEPELRRAEQILTAPAQGDTPVARAANRINAEFGH